MTSQNRKQPLALIVEDDYDASIIFNEALQAAGFVTEVIQDGRTALSQLEVLIPDLIALDLHLPHYSGSEILHKIRGDQRLVNSSVLLVTADPNLAEMLHEQADLILLKPISFTQLRDLASRFQSPDFFNGY